jgi:hypothetical protein
VREHRNRRVRPGACSPPGSTTGTRSSPTQVGDDIWIDLL